MMLTGLVATGCALDEDGDPAQVPEGGVLVGNAGPAQARTAQTGMNEEHRLVPDDFPPSTQQPLGLTDTLPQYAAKCDAAIGVTVPDFICENGTVVPTTNYASGKCDRPNRLNQECDPNSRFQVIANTAEAYVVAHCRKRGYGAGHYGDIAVIQHNKNTGATCFYQALGDLDGNVKAPSKGSGAWPWYSPAGTASIKCVRCHDNGPIVRSPYLTQLTGTNKLPGAGDFSFNSTQPYSFIGEDFASWKAYKVEVSGNTCNGCHRMGVSNMFGYDDGGALDLGIRATATSEPAKNPHSLASPIWMTPGQIYYNTNNAAAAQEIRNCALRRTENPLPSSSTCRITQYSTDPQETAPAPPPTELALQNGWTNAPYSTRNAGVALVSGLVQLKGAIANGTSAVAFTLPSGFRPLTNVYVPVDLCNAHKGRLFIQPTGVVSVQAQGAFSDAQCFTSLEGASFAPSASGFTPLVLQNGWTHAPYGTSDAAVESVGGIVHLKGAIASGTSAVAFTLPSGFRPATDVYVPVDLCDARKGRLLIQPTGIVSVQVQSAFSDAQCFTSLDGASFAQATGSFAAVTLQNGWTSSPYSTDAAGVDELGGIVRFKGAIASGTSALAFTLPSDLRPATDVYVPVNLCNATKGRLLIQPSGAVSIQAEDAAFGNAQCFTSLDGASFTLSDFTPLALQNGWTNTPYSTRAAAFALSDGVMHLRGAIANGTSAVAFTLPSGFRPATNVYVPVDLCSARKGRLFIQPSGEVSVQAEVAFSDAQCFTSLEGASFALSAASFTALTLQSGWTNAPFSTRDAAVTNDGGIIRLEGAIASGTSSAAFTLPLGFRPATDVYVPVDLCNARKGRLYIQPSGAVSVQTEGAYSDAQCFTSLEGASFALSAASFTALALQNGWTHAPYSTRDAAVTNDVGIIRFQGAIASGATAVAFTLPVGLRPAANVYVPVDLCNANKGRLFIQPSGDVTVVAEGGTFADAQCFTSLEGTSFAL